MAILTSKGVKAPHQLRGVRKVRISRDRRGAGTDDLNKRNEIKMIMIGDSYGTTPSTGHYYWEYFRDTSGFVQNENFFSKFAGGAGFGNGSYLNNIKSLSDVISDKDSITDIFVCGGWNDAKSEITDSIFQTGVEDFDNYCKENYPNARISLAHISWGNQSLLNKGTSGWRVADMLKVSLRRYLDASHNNGWRYITNSEFILHNYDKSLWHDGVHPNENGYNLLGSALSTAFLSGSADVVYEEEFTPAFIKGRDGSSWVLDQNRPVEQNGWLKIRVKVHNETTTITFTAPSGTFAIISCSTKVAPADYGISKAIMTLNMEKTKYEVFNIEDVSKYLSGTSLTNDCKAIMFNYAADKDDQTTNSGDFFLRQANISFYDGKIYIGIGDDAAYPGNFKEVSVRYILIPNMSFTFNTLDC